MLCIGMAWINYVFKLLYFLIIYMNPFDDTFNDTSTIMYTAVPLSLLALTTMFMLYKKAKRQNINVIVLMMTIGLLVGTLMYHTIRMLTASDNNKVVKQSGFYGYIGLGIGLLVGVSIQLSRGAANMSH